jgi:long-chain acyl-CoA synthetase
LRVCTLPQTTHLDHQRSYILQEVIRANSRLSSRQNATLYKYKSGVGMSPRTIPGLLDTRCAVSPVAPAFYKLGQDKRWEPVSWEQFAQKVAWMGAALIEAGVGRGDHVGILAPTSLDWEYAQMGAFAAGAIVAGIDPNYPPDQLNQVIRLLDPSVLFVQDQAALVKISGGIRDRIKLIIIFDGNPQHVAERSVQDILAACHVPELRKTGAGPEPHDAAVMVFSSGTTGSPKAIVFSHEQVLAAIDAILEAFDDLEEGTVLLCWLPLANLFQRVINFYAIARGATSYILSDPRELMDYIGTIEPHILIGVPRVFERLQSGIIGRIAKLPLPVRYLTQWSLRLGCEQVRAKVSGKRTGIAITVVWHLADKFILKQLRAVFGKRLRYFVSGSAAMPLWLLKWFEAIGLPVLEAYGVSENIIPMATNRFSLRKSGTAGKPLSPNQITLAQDGEILVRGPGIFHGYWNAPESGTERFTADGYWCTGDFGRFDEEGFLSLLGRKSEVFKTPGGKWVSPMRIEEQLQRVAYIEQSVVLQLASGAIASILSMDKAKLMCRMDRRGTDEEPVDEQWFQSTFGEALRADFRAALGDLPAYQRLAGVIVTFQQFSIAGGELTTNLKLRRKIVEARFATHLKRLETAIATTLQANRSTGSRSVLMPVVFLA